MIKTEKLISLTNQDIEKLKARKTGGIGCFLIVLIAILLISVFLYFLLRDIFGDVWGLGPVDLPSEIIVFPISLAVIALAFFIMRGYSGKAKKDIRGGMKRVVTTQVLKQYIENLDPSGRSKFANTTAFIVDIDGTGYDMSEEDYRKFNVDMWVDVHTAPLSKEFLGIYEHATGKVITEELF
jgi:hypothetical protein